MHNVPAPQQLPSQPRYTSYPDYTQPYTSNYPQGYYADHQPSYTYDQYLDLFEDFDSYQPQMSARVHNAPAPQVYRPVVNSATQRNTRYHLYTGREPRVTRLDERVDLAPPGCRPTQVLSGIDSVYGSTNPSDISASSTQANLPLAGWEPEPQDYAGLDSSYGLTDPSYLSASSTLANVPLKRCESEPQDHAGQAPSCLSLPSTQADLPLAGWETASQDHAGQAPSNYSPPSTQSSLPLAGWQAESQNHGGQVPNVNSFGGSRIRYDPIPQVTRQVSPEMHRPNLPARVVKPAKPEPATPTLLPTGESSTVLRASKRICHEGFPDITTPLPAAIPNEEIIRKWPNHLWGPLLLQVACNFSPKEIGSLNGANIKPNTIIKRMQMARVMAAGAEGKGVDAPKKDGTKRKRPSAKKEEEVQDKEGTKRKRVSAKEKMKKKEEEKEKKEEERKEEEKKAPLPPESAAAMAFRLDQEEYAEAMISKDPAFHAQQCFVKKKKPGRYRELLAAVVREREPIVVKD